MGERKGVNKYYPPDFDYKKHGSLDRYHNSHPLRERARKLKTEGILIIRFEMPYNIWCNGCNKHIGMGVRYNAEKKKMGNYYSTIIYKFRMKCHLCDQYFEIQTDPANCDYVILSGARRKEERWDAKSNEQIEMTDHRDKQQLMTNPMFKLEHTVQDKKKLHTVIPTLNEIQDLQEEKRDDYLLNKALRKTFREQKKKIQHNQEVDKQLLAKSSLDIPLVEETAEDKKLAKLIKYNTVTSFGTKHHEVREKIINESIFSPSSSNSDNIPPPLVSLKKHADAIKNVNAQAHLKQTSQNLGIVVTKRKASTSSANSHLFSKLSKRDFQSSTHKTDETGHLTIAQNATTANEKKSIQTTNDDTSQSSNSNNVLVANYSSSDESL